MSINFSQVKSMTIPEGDVKSISINGIVVWQAPSSKVLTSITLSGQTASLNRGSSFSFGGIVTAHYSDSTTADVTASTTFSGYDMSTAGTYTVTASYTEDGVTQTAAYTLTVTKIWTQVWSGSVQITQSEASSSKDIWTGVSLTGTQTLRFTFTITSSAGSGNVVKYYNNNGTTWSSLTTNKPGSPFQTNVNLNNSNVNGILGVGIGVSGAASADKYSYVKWNKTNKKFYFTGGSSSSSSGKYTLKVTKIERYY